MSKQKTILAATAGFLLLACCARADVVIPIRTGVDEDNANAVLGLGQADTNWIIISAVTTNNPGPLPRSS